MCPGSHSNEYYADDLHVDGIMGETLVKKFSNKSLQQPAIYLFASYVQVN